MLKLVSLAMARYLDRMPAHQCMYAGITMWGVAPGWQRVCRSNLSFRLNVANEVVENGLPAFALLLDGMR